METVFQKSISSFPPSYWSPNRSKQGVCFDKIVLHIDCIHKEERVAEWEREGGSYREHEFDVDFNSIG